MRARSCGGRQAGLTLSPKLYITMLKYVFLESVVPHALVAFPLDVDDRNIVVQVGANTKLFMEVNLLNVELFLLLVLHLYHIVPDSDVVDISGVPVVPEAVGRGEEVEG